jgi:hypothetical protein
MTNLSVEWRSVPMLTRQMMPPKVLILVPMAWGCMGESLTALLCLLRAHNPSLEKHLLSSEHRDLLLGVFLNEAKSVMLSFTFSYSLLVEIRDAVVLMTFN